MTRKPFLSLNSLKAPSKDVVEERRGGAAAAPAHDWEAAHPSPAPTRHAAKKHLVRTVQAAGLVLMRRFIEILDRRDPSYHRQRILYIATAEQYLYPAPAKTFSG